MGTSREFPTFANVAFLDGTMRHHAKDFFEDVTPCFQLFLYLEGYQKFYIDETMFDIDAGQGADCHPQIVLINRTKSGVLRTVANYGEQRLRKVKVSLPLRWVRSLAVEERSSDLASFVKGHMSFCIWEANKQIITLGEEIISPPFYRDGDHAQEVLKLYRLSKGLELLALGCSEMLRNRDFHMQYGVSSSRIHTEKVREYILSHLQDDLTIETISSATGASKRSIQRNFKDRYGMTLSDFIRKQRLEKARQAIENEGYTVGQAAFLAGYSNPSSFTSAFKQLYGMTPKSWRRRK